MSKQICIKGVWDSSVPNIEFNKKGISNYYQLYKNLENNYPRGNEGLKQWDRIIKKIKQAGRGKKYDCIVGFSGGTDSSYILHLAKDYNLRVLAVNLDNGWGSSIANSNIKKMLEQLEFDLFTYVINYNEMKKILRAYVKSCLPWIDIPTDLAIKSSLHKVAAKEGVKYIFMGNDFRSEGTQPTEWTYGDGRQLRHIVKKFENIRLKTYPNLTLFNMIYYKVFKKIKVVYPFYYINYNKQDAQELLEKKYNWEYYGGHHYENIYTKFAITYWLFEKFKIDKRKITFSAQILNNKMTREEALAKLNDIPYNNKEIKFDLDYFLSKLDLSNEEFKKIMNACNKSFYDYPSYYQFLKKFRKVIDPITAKIFNYRPMTFFQMDIINRK